MLTSVCVLLAARSAEQVAKASVRDIQLVKIAANITYEVQTIRLTGASSGVCLMSLSFSLSLLLLLSPFL